jgi:PAS domain S-box-containing protein
MHINTLAIPLIATSFLMFALGIITRSHKSVPGVKYFSLLMFSGSIYSFFYALELSVTGIPSMSVFYKLQYTAFTFIPAFCLLFAICYTRKTDQLNRGLLIAVLALPAITVPVIFTNDFHLFFVREMHPGNPGSFPVLAITPGPWYRICQVYSAIALFAGIVLLVRMYIFSAPAFRKQAGIILAGSGISLLVYIMYLAGTFPAGLDVNPVSFAVSGLFVFAGISRFKLFSFAPLARNMLFDSIPDGVIVLDRYFRLVDINKPATRFFGVRNRDTGRPTGEVFSSWPEIISNMTGSEKTRRFEISRITANSVLFLDCVFSPLVDEHDREWGQMLVAHDVTRQRKAEIDREQSEEKFRIIFENAPVGLMYFDKNGVVELCNEFFGRILGTGKDKVVGMTLWQLSDRRIHDILKRVFSGHRAMFEGNYSIEAGARPVYVKGIFEPLISRGNQVEGGLCIMEDISTRKAAENRIRSANEELKRSNAEKDRFFSILAHDLRSPFTAFLGFTDFLEESIDTIPVETVRAIATSMKEAANNLYRLLENLLNWSRVQQGLMRHRPSEFGLRPKILESIEPLLIYANDKLISVSYHIPEECTVFADPLMFDSIVRNLFTNAVKFTPRNGSIDISASSLHDGNVRVCFTDTGIGMDRETRESLFRLDVKTNRAGTEGELSTGLGLILIRELIEINEGTIHVESQEGIGSRFYVTLKKSACAVIN